MSGLPTIATERLRLRAPDPRDFEPHAAFMASDAARFVGGPEPQGGAPRSFEAMRDHVTRRGFGRWTVTERGSDAAVGLVGLLQPDEWPEPEIAWIVWAAAEGRGCTQEAARAARRHACEALGRVTAISLIAEGNHRSIALARGPGRRPDGAFDHPRAGPVPVWRHPGPDARSVEAA